MDLEHRSIQMRGGSDASASGPGRIAGRAIRYDSLSEDLGGFRERFARGSVKLADDLLVLFGHDPNQVIGRTSAGTARAYDDGQGIVFDAQPPDATWARDLAASMTRGDVRQCSFAFRVLPGGDDFYYDTALGSVVRVVHSAEVSELSIASMPAYPATEATIT